MSTDPPVKRMRVFAGPNGSGKSTIIKEIARRVRTGTYINADDIEQSGRLHKFINLGNFGVSSEPDHFHEFLNTSTLRTKAISEGYPIDLALTENVITVGSSTNSYEAAIIAEYLRLLIIEKGDTFTFETVMSHSGKLNVFKKAHEEGYKN